MLHRPSRRLLLHLHPLLRSVHLPILYYTTSDLIICGSYLGTSYRLGRKKLTVIE